MIADLANKLNLRYSDSLLIFDENRVSSNEVKDTIEVEFNEQSLRLLSGTKFDKIAIRYRHDHGNICDVLKTIMQFCNVKTLVLINDVPAIDTEKSNGHVKLNKNSISEFISSEDKTINAWFLDETEDKFYLLLEVINSATIK